MQLEAQLVHADSGKRVVQVRALLKGQVLGSALGEGSTAEEAEDRARERLLARLAQEPPKPGALKPEPGPGPLPQQIPLVRQAPLVKQAPPSQASEEFPSDESPGPESPGAESLSPESPSEEPRAEPEDWSSELASLDLQLQRLGWGREQEALYLERSFGHPSRNRLTNYGDLLAYLQALEAIAPGSDPSSANVPMRRSDLLGQCDQLLAQLQWDGAQGRAFLGKHFSLTSRQQLNDNQLLQFNMLLEGELLDNQG